MSSSARTLVLLDSSLEVFCLACLRCEQESFDYLWVEALREPEVQRQLQAFISSHALSCGTRYVRGVLGREAVALRGEVLGVPVWGSAGRT